MKLIWLALMWGIFRPALSIVSLLSGCVGWVAVMCWDASIKRANFCFMEGVSVAKDSFRTWEDPNEDFDTKCELIAAEIEDKQI